MAISILTAEQIQAGAGSLLNNKLRNSQVDDLISIFRGFLKGLASTYPLRSTFENLEDSATENRCAKLAACLSLWSDLQFDVSAFEATNASRTGFTDSAIGEQYKIFEYAFCLFWDLPAAISAGRSNTGSFDQVSTRIYGGNKWRSKTRY